MIRSRMLVVLVSVALTVAACNDGAESASTIGTASTSDAPAPVSADATTTVAPVAADSDTTYLTGLPFDEFLDAAADALLLRSPQAVTEAGLAANYGLRNNRLDDLSDEYVRETQALEVAVLEVLRGYDRGELTATQQVSYDVIEWYLDDRVRGHRWMYHEYPLHHFLRSYHGSTFSFFTDILPVASREGAEDYVACLWQVKGQGAQVLEGLQLRRGMGIMPPDFVVTMARRAMVGQIQLRSPDPSDIAIEDVELYTVFAEKLGELGLPPDDETALLDEAGQAIRESVVPAWIDLIDFLDDIEVEATDDAGVWALPDGDEFYAYMLRRETSTDLTPEEVHTIGLAEVERIRAEMLSRFGELGYDTDRPLADLMARAVDEAGFYRADTDVGRAEVISAYEDLIDGVEARISSVFDLRPEADVAVIGEMSFGGGGGYYQSGSEDGSRPGAFHTGVGGGSVAKYRMPTILYHEAVPGHHFQIALAQELNLPQLRRRIFFNGYVEGWALYAEYLAAELGLYDDDPYGDLGRLHLELLRAVRLVTDTGIHSMGWSREEAKAYMNEAMGERGGGSDHEVDRYVVLPAQATGYKIGMLEILELRRYAEDRLGEAFDLREFHNVVIGNGSLPLGVLDRLVREYVADAATAG